MTVPERDIVFPPAPRRAKPSLDGNHYALQARLLGKARTLWGEALETAVAGSRASATTAVESGVFAARALEPLVSLPKVSSGAHWAGVVTVVEKKNR
jgi:hypothetical protein